MCRGTLHFSKRNDATGDLHLDVEHWQLCKIWLVNILCLSRHDFNGGAAFLMLLLLMGSQGGSEKLTDEAIEETLEKVVKLLAYISDKDLFAEFYRKKLARRLLNDRSSSDEHERSILSRLKQQCGAQFTSKVCWLLRHTHCMPPLPRVYDWVRLSVLHSVMFTTLSSLVGVRSWFDRVHPHTRSQLSCSMCDAAELALGVFAALVHTRHVSLVVTTPILEKLC